MGMEEKGGKRDEEEEMGADRWVSRLCAGVGVVVCVGGAVASLDGEADFLSPLLLILLLLLQLLQLLFLHGGTGLHGVFGGHGGVAARPVLLQGRAPRWVGSARELQPLEWKERERERETSKKV